MFYNNVPTKTAVGNEGGRKYSPAATKKLIFFQLQDERRSEGRFSTLAFGETTSDRPGDSGHQEVSPSVGICTGSLAEAGLGVGGGFRVGPFGKNMADPEWRYRFRFAV
ncbi:Uncharacterized protein DBV15_09220 [Temnothorax longispinosus]|uniref:Uncharacterized protein n=1 Tax=Temnothorax longispinosus TaxID=300112 RepID=A0A4S2L6U7_9HYME|nr:Uncharacterized protein DBV15_09220 [Temnothorax longispinosus]